MARKSKTAPQSVEQIAETVQAVVAIEAAGLGASIPDSDVTAYVGTFKSEDAQAYTRVKIVGNVLRRFAVGTKGAPSQNRVLAALSDKIAAALGTDSARRKTGWKSANLARYAQVGRMIDTLGLSVTAPLAATLYAFQNADREAWNTLGDTLGTGKTEADVLAHCENGFAALAAARSAKAEQDKQDKADAEQAARDKAAQIGGADGDNGGQINADDVNAAPMSAGAFIASTIDALARHSGGWTEAERESVAQSFDTLAMDLRTAPAVAEVPAE